MLPDDGPPLLPVDQMPSSRVVLHLVDRSTGGVPVAVRGYIDNSPAGFSHVVASPPVDGAPASVWNQGRADRLVRHLPWDTGSPLRAVASLRRVLAQVRPDVVHAHSSFPGVYARVVRTGGARLVYTPHCFAFERRDIGRATRVAYRGVERVLRDRAALLAAAGPGEAVAAERLGYARERVGVIPNVPSVHRRPPAATAPDRSPRTLTVGMLGRWAPQKDPAAFIAVVRHLNDALPGVKVRAKWIGGGEGAIDAPADIEVTGWRTPEGVAAELAELDVYLHTAAWEAAVAIAVLDAVECGLPILARPIPAMPGLHLLLRTDTGMERLVDAVRAERLDPWGADNRQRWARYLGGRFTPEAQREALQHAWG